ncbi:nucleotide sugar dehydrogenase [Rhodoplanes sp. Z2-YC6860]|uniref:nucleotide sugar dehydrogenase n=1 Tax=Rhodoplanes sp. Z2-YC6860 TaxID=674703 RepID=UPI00078E503B|nr:nucleotide sugar dehydrogenase [Rhodoplanes sp. Z2-YC6860]AMN43400.1 nucleotide sugar dehydrogenase [Rhodoplanes sp. Z2-YC6860]
MNIAERPASARTVTAQTADLTVVGGAGHVGVPLVLSFAAKGLTVNINDLNTTSLETLRSGRMPFIEHGADELLQKALAEGRLFFTSKPSDISTKGPVIVTIGTPVDEFLNPVRRVIQDCVDPLLPHMRSGQLLILRSTLFPGTTDWIDSHIRRQGNDLKVAFCPERIAQGYGIEELRRMPQIVSGLSPEAEQEAKALFNLIAPEIVTLSPMEAEFAKLFNNAYRYLEFAITNQFYLIAKSAGLDYTRILEGMKHNYPRAKGIPTPGFAAGPCLVKDTMQLLAFARNEFALGNAAIMVNEGLPLHIIADLRRDYDLPNMTVGLLGMAFKAESDDARASLSYKLKNALAGHARDVLTTDPLVTTDPSLLPLDEVIEKSDILIVCTPHRCYKDADLKGKPVMDVWGLLRGSPNVIS